MDLTHAGARQEAGGKQKRINVGRQERNASMVGGASLMLSGLRNIARKRFLPGLAMMVAGGLFFYRGKTGHCPLYQAADLDTTGTGEKAVRVEKFLTINRTPQQVYDFWRNQENLPRFLRHIESVQMTGELSSHWKARGPAGTSLEWDAELVEDYPGQLILWRSVGDADLPNEGSVEFREASGGRGTEVKLTIRYYPPGGAAGKIAAKLADTITARQIEEDLKRLKQILETGASASSEGTKAAA